ncbi:MAG: AAA family ATPase, partial [Pseudomonadales bacterium]|nr:AAA family ATPase [Pseudomonadales bacterium]
MSEQWDREKSLEMDQAEAAKDLGMIVSKPLGDPQAIRVQRRPWLVEGLLLRRSVTALVAPGGTGKSCFALTLGCSLASGTDVLGLGVEEKTSVLLLSYEDDRSEIERRYKAVCTENDMAFDTHWLHLPEYRFNLFQQEGSQLASTEFASGLVDHCKDNGIGLLIVDPLSAINPADENSNSAMATLIQELARIAREANCSVLLVHHTRKAGRDEKQKGNVETTRGAKALTDGCRIVATLHSMSGREATQRKIDVELARSYILLSDAKQNYQSAA